MKKNIVNGEKNKMQDKLPYVLDIGAFATTKYLIVDEWHLNIIQGYEPIECRKEKTNTDIMTNTLYWNIEWPAAAERLQYKEGELWCYMHNETDNMNYVVELGSHDRCRQLFPTLHRIAAVFCSTPEAFAVLHWCVQFLGKKNSKESQS